MSARPIYSYNLAIGASSVQGTRVVPYGVQRVRLAATSACYVTIVNGTSTAAAPSAGGLTGGSILISPATAGEEFIVQQGDQISVIQVSAGGVLNVAEMSN